MLPDSFVLAMLFMRGIPDKGCCLFCNVHINLFISGRQAAMTRSHVYGHCHCRMNFHTLIRVVAVDSPVDLPR